MRKSPEQQLIDVVALSHQRCNQPISAHLAYATKHNFVGTPITGYTKGLTQFALMEKEAAYALCKAQNAFLKDNLRILIYDSYRPRSAVEHFIRWSLEPVTAARDPQHELAMKQKHYPHIEKSQLFELGYVSKNSNHCLGHTVDLVLIDNNNNELFFGACFDFMDTLSHHTAEAAEIGEQAYANRQRLLIGMQEAGFIPYQKEFWHYHYHKQNIDYAMNIAITANLIGLGIV